MVRERRNWPLALAALAGLAVSAYLTVIHLQGVLPPCGSAGGCAKVQSSGFAELLGIPISAYGASAYLLIFSFSLLRSPLAASLALVVSLASFLFTAYLKYVELFVLDALCRWCLVSAVAVSFCLVFSALAFYRMMRE